MSGVFDHLISERERKRALIGAYRALVPGGTLVFDAFTGQVRERSDHPAGTYSKGEYSIERYISTRLLDSSILCLTLRYVERRSGGRYEHTVESDIWSTSAEHILSLVQSAGFVIAHTYGDYQYAPYTDSSDMLLIEARRR